MERELMGLTKAILVASFGTTHEDAYQNSICTLEEQVHATYPEYAVFSACTSSIVRCALLRRGKTVYSPEEALRRIAEEGFSHVCALPTHLTAGFEYEKLEAALCAVQGRFESATLARPLLDSQEDIYAVLRAVVADAPLGPDEGLLLMGHGTAHPSNAAYARCNACIAQLGLGPVYVGTVEAEPGLNDALRFFQEQGVSSLLLSPFLFVAGDHAKEDLAGESDSWLTAATAAGFLARARLKGLGEYEVIRALYLRHLEDVL